MAERPHELDRRFLAGIIESADDAIVSHDLDGVIGSWNTAAERIFGYTAAEAVGQSVRLIVPPDRDAEEVGLLTRVRAGQRLNHFETIRQRKDGTRVRVSLAMSPIMDETATVIGGVRVARDLSDRMEADLVAKRLKAVVDSSDDAIVTKTLDSIITTWNRAAERMFGYSADEAIGQSIRMIIPPELQAEEDDVLARIRAGETVDHFETRRRRKDGSELIISLTVSPIRNDVGVVVGASKIARDVTDRVRLREAQHEHAFIAEKVGQVGVLVASSLEQQTIAQSVADLATALTRAECGVFHYTVADGPSRDAYTCEARTGIARDTFEAFFQHQLTAMFARGGRAADVVRIDDVARDSSAAWQPPGISAPDGRAQVRSYLTVPVKSVSGAVLGALLFGHSQPGAFSEQHERLAIGISAWASVALENARLYAAAQRADRLKDEFLAVLSHELRTPLNAILGYARLLRGGLLNAEKTVRAVEALERNSTSLTQIVDDVLDVSRIISGKIRLDVQPVELPLVIHNAVATVQPAADAKGVRIQTILDPHVGPVSGDPGRLQQVVWNLLSNAVKFTPRDGRVQVRLERNDSHLEIGISDTGIGIAPDFLPYVFDRFRQAEAGTTRKTGGLGLGLSIVRHIVEMHGGSVQAASDGSDRGATFRVRLPLMIVHPAVVDAPSHHPPAESAARLAGLGDLGGIRVLAVDDEDDALALLRVVLETAGAHVTTCSSAVDALAQVDMLEPDALVVDIGMPQMDGFDFIARLRASSNASTRDLPAAALTALARAEDRTRALRSGFDMHLAKPVDPWELVASVATLAKHARRR